MKVGVYNKNAIPPTRAVVTGLRACGDTPFVMNPEYWSAPEARRDLDAVIVFSLGGGGQIWSYYRRHGVPVFIVEQGHIERGTYHQFSIDKLNWLPELAISDRREALGIKRPRNVGKADGYVLFLGQKPGDAQHCGVDVNAYLGRAMAQVRELSNRQFVFRRHPKDRIGALPDSNCIVSPDAMTLEQTFIGAHSVVTFNSNAGLKAVLTGIPTYCHPCAIYAGACKSDLADIEEPYVIDSASWYDTLDRICYAQWTEPELETGKPWEFVKAQVKAEAVA